MKRLHQIEALERYPTLLKHGSKITLFGEEHVLHASDERGNSPGVGYLWARQKKDNAYVTKAIVSIFDGRVFSEGTIILTIPDDKALVRLYMDMYPEKPTWFERLTQWLRRK